MAEAISATSIGKINMNVNLQDYLYPRCSTWTVTTFQPSTVTVLLTYSYCAKSLLSSLAHPVSTPSELRKLQQHLPDLKKKKKSQKSSLFLLQDPFLISR